MNYEGFRHLVVRYVDMSVTSGMHIFMSPMRWATAIFVQMFPIFLL